MSADLLFQPFDTRDIAHLEVRRPLGLFSDAVVERMPTALAGSASDLQNFADDLNDLLVDVALPRPGSPDLLLARLDILFAYTGLVRGAAALNMEPDTLVSERFKGLIRHVAQVTQRPPVLTYEDLVITNPLETDPRIFTIGLLGRSEFHFMLGSRLIENRAAQAIRKAQNYLRDDGQELSLLQSMKEDCAFIVDVIAKFRDGLSTAHFLTFREYYHPPIEGHRGISAEYTAKLPHLRSLVDGDFIENKDPTYFQTVFQYAAYYPRADYHNMLRDISPEFCINATGAYPMEGRSLAIHMGNRRGGSLAIAIERLGNPEEHVAALADIRHSLDAFTDIHAAAVTKHMNDMAGTGGSKEPKKHLARIRNMHREAAQMRRQLSRPIGTAAIYGQASPDGSGPRLI